MDGPVIPARMLIRTKWNSPECSEAFLDVVRLLFSRQYLGVSLLSSVLFNASVRAASLTCNI